MKHPNCPDIVQLFDNAPGWSSRYRRTAVALSPAWRSWLTDPGSLTRRLDALSPGQFRVQRLADYVGRLSPTECHDLGMRWPQTGWLREVSLLVDGKEWVRARTVVPASSMTAFGGQLRQLGTRSLGSFLFSQPDLRRQILRICPVPASGQRSHQLQWARRSVFLVRKRPILVTEAFHKHIPTPPASAFRSGG